MTLDEMEALVVASTPAELWCMSYAPANKEGTHWQSLGPIAFGMLQAIRDSEYSAAAREVLPKLLRLAQLTKAELETIPEKYLSPGGRDLIGMIAALEQP